MGAVVLGVEALMQTIVGIVVFVIIIIRTTVATVPSRMLSGQLVVVPFVFALEPVVTSIVLAVEVIVSVPVVVVATAITIAIVVASSAAVTDPDRPLVRVRGGRTHQEKHPAGAEEGGAYKNSSVHSRSFSH